MEKFIINLQEKGTPAENIQSFEMAGETVVAVFDTEQNCNDYINKHSPIINNENWYDKVGFMIFTKSENTITGKSTYHNLYTIVQVFEKGLKW